MGDLDGSTGSTGSSTSTGSTGSTWATGSTGSTGTTIRSTGSTRSTRSTGSTGTTIGSTGSTRSTRSTGPTASTGGMSPPVTPKHLCPLRVTTCSIGFTRMKHGIHIKGCPPTYICTQVGLAHWRAYLDAIHKHDNRYMK